MKTMKNILLAIVLVTSFSSYATELNPTAPSSNVTVVTFNKVKKGQQVTIFDSETTILYQEQIKNNGSYVKNFDLTRLKNGSYSIVLDQSIRTITKYFEVLNGIVKFNTELEETFYKPIALIKEDRLFVSQLITTDEALDIEIYYDNQLIKAETLSDAKQLGRIYKLSMDKNGTYTVIMKSSGKTFYKVFEF